MEAILLIARIILAAVFAVAGIAKLFDRAGSEKAIVDFGVPESIAKPLSVLLPLAEIATAILLLPLATAWFGAVSALALLLVFVGGIAYNFARGNTPDCHCFGQIHSEPVGWSTLIRNSILAAIAGFVVFAGRETTGASAFAWLDDLNTAEKMNLIFGVLTIGLLAFVAFKLKNIQAQQIVLQRHVELLQLGEGSAAVEHEHAMPPTEGLPVGALVPAFSLPDANGKQFLSKDLLNASKPSLLFFVSPSCKPCAALLPDIEDWQRQFGEKINFIFVSSGAAKENVEKFGADKIVLLQKDNETMTLFRAKWTPTALLVNADGTIGSRLTTGDAAIRALVQSIRPNLSNGHVPKSFLIGQNGSKLGEPAPEFALQNLDGKQVKLEDFRGKKTLLLFWGPGCGFCQAMLPDLQKWERQNDRTAELLVVSRGEVETNRKQNLKSPILLEKAMEIQNLFGANGTPNGIIIDEEGKIASEVAVGADEVFALVGEYKR
ncbi:MAG TPA: MauE/DoxX family redox-associated membrane protein [Pyrinomonadaceae bacterium]|nr:MauE/DoxX family redox-associated membrane protein [Pyrinomonadaceae bacterium]